MKMATSIPIDVMRDTKNMFTDMKSKANNLRIEANEKNVQADLLYNQAMKIESMYDNWLKCFPETSIP
jgi:hypothetical protein